MNKRRFTLFVIIWLAAIIPVVIILTEHQARPTPSTPVVAEDPRQYDALADIERQLAEKKARYEANISKYPTTPEKLLELVNSERAREHIAPLRLDSRLNHSASLKLADMHKYDYNDHVNHDGTQGYELIFKQINECTYGGENIKSDAKYETAKDIVDDYMSSTAGHREAILNSRYDLVGFHTEHGRNVMHFCDLP